MKIFEGICLVLKLVLPAHIAKQILIKIEKSLNVLRKAKKQEPTLLVLFWIVKFVFLPIIWIWICLQALIKIVLIWMLPCEIYGYVGFIIKNFFKDIIKIENVGVGKAIKRAKLRYELFAKGGEKKCSYGDDNPNKTFYVIRPYYFLEPNDLILNNVANLLTQYYYCLQKLSYAIENDYVPVVDWEHFGRLPHSENYPVNGTENSWEYYWTQPSDFTLAEVYKSKNVILSTQNVGAFGYIPSVAMTPPYKKYAEQLSKLCPKYSRFVQFNEKTQKYIDNMYNNLFPKDFNVLGVVLRGTAYGVHATQFSSHPKQVSIDELIINVKYYMEKWEYEYCFFVNEVQEIVEKMKKEFGDKIIIMPRLRDSITRKTDGSQLNPMYFDGQRYKTNLDYVTEIALLSKCDALIGSMSSGTRTALIWNENKYAHINIFDKGLH